MNTLKKLSELKEKGVITISEFEESKATLLNSRQNETLKTSFVRLKTDYISFWKKAFCWHSRASVEEFFGPVLINFLLITLIGFFAPQEKTLMTRFVLHAVFFFPFLSVLIRRLHDLGKPASYVLCPCLLFLLFVTGTIVFSGYLLMGPFSFSVWIAQVVFGIGTIWALCTSVNRVWFVTAKEGTNTSNKYGKPCGL